MKTIHKILNTINKVQNIVKIALCVGECIEAVTGVIKKYYPQTDETIDLNHKEVHNETN